MTNDAAPHESMAVPSAADAMAARQSAIAREDMPASASSDAPVRNVAAAPPTERWRERVQPPRFSLRAIFVMQVLFCVALVGVLYLGIWALLALWVATVVNAIKRFPGQSRWQQHFIFSLMGGIVLPLLCLAFDPGIIYSPPDFISNPQPPSSWAHLAVALYLSQIVGMLVWLLAGWRMQRFGRAFTAYFAVGVAAAILTQIPFAPLGLIAIVGWGIGFVCFTPTLTAIVFMRNARLAWRAAEAQGVRAVSGLRGLAAAVLLAAALWGLFHTFSPSASWPASLHISTERLFGRLFDTRDGPS